MGVVQAWADDGQGKVDGYNVEHRKSQRFPRPETRQHLPPALLRYINGHKVTNYHPWSCAEADALAKLIETRGPAIDFRNIRVSNPREDSYTLMEPCANCMQWLTFVSKQGSERVYRLNDELLDILSPRAAARRPLPQGLVNPDAPKFALPASNPWSKGPPKL